MAVQVIGAWPAPVGVLEVSAHPQGRGRSGGWRWRRGGGGLTAPSLHAFLPAAAADEADGSGSKPKAKRVKPPTEVTTLDDGWTLHPPSFIYK